MESQIVQGLIARGIAPIYAQALTMNIGDESGFNPSINEAKPLVAGSRGGFGLNQWTGPRRVAYEQFAASRGKPLDDLDTQLDFTVYELQGPEKAAWDKISQADDVGQAAAAVVNYYLRPSEEHRARREAAYLGRAGSTNALSYGSPSQPAQNALAAPAEQQRPRLQLQFSQLDPRQFQHGARNALAAY